MAVSVSSTLLNITKALFSIILYMMSLSVVDIHILSVSE